MTFLKCLGIALLAVLLAGSGDRVRLPEEPDVTAPGKNLPQSIQPFSPNDVSLLFPAPTKAEDFATLIAVRDLATTDSQDPAKHELVWPIPVFQRFLEIADGPAGQVSAQARIMLPAEVRTLDAWFVAGVRIDAGAPGLSDDIRTQFGQLPEIRLIVQPVTRNPDGTPKVHDIAGHLIFDFTLPPSPPPQAGCLPRRLADVEAFNLILRDADALRTKLSSGQLGKNKVTTSNSPLGIHPGLADPTTAKNFRDEIKRFLEKHLSAQRLDGMAVTGLPEAAPAPWIFLSMAEVPPGFDPSLPNGGFTAIHSPTLDGQQFSQMLGPGGSVPRVLPAPHTNNLNPITCASAASPLSVPVANRRGVSTSDLFASPPPAADKTKEITDLIADPSRSHFFNTDCVSCHTETRRAMDLLKVKEIPGIDSGALPNGAWNVRNFGWSPAGARPQATVTRRAAAETAAVVEYINTKVIPNLQRNP